MSGEWHQDVKRYGGYRAFLREQSIYIVAAYRFGRCLNSIENEFVRRFFLFIYLIPYRILESFLGVSIPLDVEIGAGIRIWHFGQIFINNSAVIGKNCTIRHGVTIGNKRVGGGAPVIGDNVDIGANSMIIGEVNVGDNVVIGAMSLVNKSIPAGKIAYGIPARVFGAGN